MIMEYSLDRKLQGFQLIAQEKLQAIIFSIPGRKNLILEKSVIKPLEHICSASWLKLKGVHHIYMLDVVSAIPRRLDGVVHVYMIRSKLEIFTKVLQHVHENEAKLPTDTNSASNKSVHIICVPSCFMYFNTVLEEEGLFGLVQLHSFNWDLIYLDNGVMSMEVSNVFSSLFLHADTSLVPSVARTLRTLQMACGRFPFILSYGDHSAKIIQILNLLGPWPHAASSENGSDFAAMLIIDRDKDYVSSLLTPANYAGLLLEVFENRTGEVDIAAGSNRILNQKLEIFKLQGANDKSPLISEAEKYPPKSIINMNSQADEIYGENRYKHFAQASSLVRAQAKSIGLEVEKLSNMKLNEMHEYVARKLPKVAELKTKVMRHLNASETVIEMLATNFQRIQSLEEDILNNTSRKKLLHDIEELLTTDAQKYNTLRLLCLFHLSSGLSSEELTQFMRNYCNYFGSQHLSVFPELANAGLLPSIEEKKSLNKSAKLLSNLPLPKFQQTEFQANANRLKLLVSASSGHGGNANVSYSVSRAATAGEAACPSYVFNHLYIPLVAQLCSLLLNANTAEDLASKLDMVEKLQIHLSTDSFTSSAYNLKSFPTAVRQAQVENMFPIKKRNLFVFIVGGITYSEIGACEMVGRLTDSQIIIASDSIVSGGDIISAAFERVHTNMKWNSR